MSRAVYEIKVRGDLPLGLLDDFGADDSQAGSGTTVIWVELADQAALHGMIRALRQASVTLVDVHRGRPVD